MAFTKAIVCCTMAFLAAASVISFAPFANSPFCASADDDDKKALCTELVNGGETWAEAMTNALNDVIYRIECGKPIVDHVWARLPKNLEPQTMESLNSTCQEAYDDILFNMQQCLGFVKRDPDSSLRSYLSAALFTQCTDGLGEFGVSLPEVTQFDHMIKNLTEGLLAIAENKP